MFDTPDEWARLVFLTYGILMVTIGIPIGISIYKIWIDLKK